LTKEKVLLDHDGGLDDYLALLLLLTMEDVETLGVVVTPADCYIEPAVSATRKIMDLVDYPHIPVAASTVRGVNAFPRSLRQRSFQVDHLPILNEKETVATAPAGETGQHYLVRALQETPDPVTLLVTGPLTTISAVLDADPAVERKIRRILWMGGALNVSGNVSRWVESGQDGTAEWNVYWDPTAACRVWETDIAIVLCPLDVTRTVKVTSDFVRRLVFPVSESGRRESIKLSHT